MAEYKEKYLKVTRQLLDMQQADGDSNHECKRGALEILLQKARAEANRWEKEANYWKREYEAVQQSY